MFLHTLTDRRLQACAWLTIALLASLVTRRQHGQHQDGTPVALVHHWLRRQRAGRP